MSCPSTQRLLLDKERTSCLVHRSGLGLTCPVSVRNFNDTLLKCTHECTRRIRDVALLVPCLSEIFCLEVSEFIQRVQFLRATCSGQLRAVLSSQPQALIAISPADHIPESRTRGPESLNLGWLAWWQSSGCDKARRLGRLDESFSRASGPLLVFRASGLGYLQGCGSQELHPPRSPRP